MNPFWLGAFYTLMAEASVLVFCGVLADSGPVVVSAVLTYFVGIVLLVALLVRAWSWHRSG